MNRALLAAVLAVSCSHTRPAEMTAEEHRAEAKVHQQAARNEAEQYHPGLDVRLPGARGPFADPGNTGVSSTYNPTASHLGAADREMRRAAEHLDAARKL